MDTELEKDNSISPAEFNLIATQVDDGDADPEQVRRLLEDICNRVDREEGLPPVVLRYIRDSLRRHLEGRRTSLERSFGVKRVRKPRVERAQLVSMAVEILQLRLKGRNYEYAVELVGQENRKKRTVVGEAWSAHKFDALLELWGERSRNKKPLTEREIARLEKILKRNL